MYKIVENGIESRGFYRPLGFYKSSWKFYKIVKKWNRIEGFWKTPRIL